MRSLTITDARLTQTILWYQQLQETNNEAFMPLFADRHRYLVLKGGGGSGKSIFAGRKMLERAVSEPGHRMLVCRKVGKSLRESCYKQLIGQLTEHYSHIKWRANKTDMTISFPNGSEIIFSGLDDVEKLKSIYNITAVWIEEASEILESDLNQLTIRLRGRSRYYKQIILTFNPISINHWLKKRFFDVRDEDVCTHESTYKDNRFLPEEDCKTLEKFKDTDEYYYMVYCLGMWGVTGQSVFNSKAVNARLREVSAPRELGIFAYDYNGLRISDIRFETAHEGYIRIYRAPEHGVPYVIGADTAGEGSDKYVAQVIDNRTGEQVAMLRHSQDEDLFAHQLYCLGMYYNTALLAVETNFSTYPVRELQRLGYPNQYVREAMDDYTHAVKRSFGFVTSPKTRPVIIAGLIKAVRDDISIINDITTLEEMLTFVRNESFRPEAESGAHDDTVMALAIAHFVRPHQSYLTEEEVRAQEEWTDEMWEDYDNASEEDRAYLLKKWGGKF